MDSNYDNGILLKQILDAIEKRANNELRGEGLTLTQLSALAVLHKEDEKKLSLKQLENRLHVAQPTVAGIVNRLKRKGLVELLGDAEDKRVKYVRLSPDGCEKCEAMREKKQQLEKQLIEGLTHEEQAVFRAVLLKVWKNIV